MKHFQIGFHDIELKKKQAENEFRQKSVPFLPWETNVFDGQNKSLIKIKSISNRLLWKSLSQAH